MQNELARLIGTVLIPVLLISTGHWYLFVLVFPLAGYLMIRYLMLRVPGGSVGIFDPAKPRNYVVDKLRKESPPIMLYHLSIFLGSFCWSVTV